MNMISVLFILAINHYTGVTTWAYELMKGLDQFNIDVVFISDNPYHISKKEYVKDISQYVNVISSLDFNKKYDVVLFDSYGVLKNYNGIIEGARETMASLEKRKVP